MELYQERLLSVAGWKAGSQSKTAALKPGRGFGKDVLKLAADIQMTANGKIRIAKATFEAWREKFRALSAKDKADIAEQILILASRYFRAIGAQASEAIAQLLVIAGELTGALTPADGQHLGDDAPDPKAARPKVAKAERQSAKAKGKSPAPAPKKPSPKVKR